jgi:hypothetical protein
VSKSATISISVLPSYVVTFDLAGGTRKEGNEGGGALKQTIYHGRDATAPRLNPRDYYTFAGWNGTYTKITKDTTITATWAKVYIGPKAPPNPRIEHTKNKLTLKENWKCAWDAAEPQSIHSPIHAYRIRIFKSDGNSEVSIPIINSAGNTLSKSSGQIHYCDTTELSLTFDPVKSGFKVGDKVRLNVVAYSLDGADKVQSSIASDFAPLEVKNAGIVYVKVPKAGSSAGYDWTEGQVWVKVGEYWLEAETVYTKVGTDWKESI